MDLLLGQSSLNKSTKEQPLLLNHSYVSEQDHALFADVFNTDYSYLSNLNSSEFNSKIQSENHPNEIKRTPELSMLTKSTLDTLGYKYASLHLAPSLVEEPSHITTTLTNVSSVDILSRSSTNEHFPNSVGHSLFVDYTAYVFIPEKAITLHLIFFIISNSH